MTEPSLFLSSCVKLKPASTSMAGLVVSGLVSVAGRVVSGWGCANAIPPASDVADKATSRADIFIIDSLFKSGDFPSPKKSQVACP